MPKPAVLALIGLVVVIAIIAVVSMNAAAAPSPISPGNPAPQGNPPPQSAVASGRHSFCENDWASKPVSCPAGKRLVVKKLMYSRPALQPCTHSNPSANQLCAGKDYTAKAQSLVSGGTLVFPSAPNTALGEDPCPNIYKQVDIDYECQ